MLGGRKDRVLDMTNEGFSRQFSRLDKQLRRLEVRLAPPKQTEAERHRLACLWADMEAGRKRANACRVRDGLEPYPEPPPFVPSDREFTIHDLMASLNEGRARCAANQRKVEAEAERVKCEAEAQSQGSAPNELPE
jgi:hypothetical protein